MCNRFSINKFYLNKNHSDLDLKNNSIYKVELIEQQEKLF